MSNVAYTKRVLAFAGILQPLHLVDSIARTGLASQDVIEDSLRSIFVTNPDSISEVYAGTAGVRTGLKLATEFLLRFNVAAHADLLRYTLAVVALERKLAQQPAMLRDVGARIATLEERRRLEPGGDRIGVDVVSALSGIYETTLSTIEPRIRIAGKKNHLAEGANTERIRALLLAAVRSAVLWHQVGGRRWQLLLARGSMRDALKLII